MRNHRGRVPRVMKTLAAEAFQDGVFIDTLVPLEVQDRAQAT